MSTRPSVYPEWATTLSADGPLGGNNRVEPAAGDKITGFPFPMQPPREWFNWLFYTNYDWIKYLDEALVSGGSSSFSQNNTSTTGLTFGYNAGAFFDQFAETVTEVAAGTIALTAASTNWIVYRPGTGITKIVGAFSGGTAGDIPLWKAVTSGSAITTLTDVRTVADRKIVQFSATDKLLGRSTAGAGDAEEITCTAAGRAILDDADAAAQRTTLAAAGSGAVTASGLTQATARILGRTTASTGAIEEISVGAGLSLSGGTLSGNASVGMVIGGKTVTDASTIVCTTAIPFDDTVPTNTEGDEIITTTYSAVESTSQIQVEVQVTGGSSGLTNNSVALAIFAGSTCIGTISTENGAAYETFTMNGTGLHLPASTSSVTYSARLGDAFGYGVRVNGVGASRMFGGSSATIMKIKEIKV